MKTAEAEAAWQHKELNEELQAEASKVAAQVERLKAVCATLQEELRGQETSDQEGESLVGFAVVATCSAGVALARCARAARRGPSIEPMCPW